MRMVERFINESEWLDHHFNGLQRLHYLVYTYYSKQEAPEQQQVPITHGDDKDHHEARRSGQHEYI